VFLSLLRMSVPFSREREREREREGDGLDCQIFYSTNTLGFQFKYNIYIYPAEQSFHLFLTSNLNPKSSQQTHLFQRQEALTMH
jgi:hypothetical protein